MTIAQSLEADLKEALRAGDAVRTSTIRLAREAIEGFSRGGRDDLVAEEQLEMAILLGYLPAPLEDD